MATIEDTITAEFFATLEALGITPRGSLDLQMDGKIHRFSTEDDRGGEKSGGYYIHVDGWPNWGVQDFRQHREMQKFKLDSDKLPEDPSRWNRNTQTASSQRAKKRQEEQEEAERSRARAYDEYSRADAEAAKFHPYCKLKRVAGVTQKVRVVVAKLEGDFCNVGDLLIPLVNATSRRFQTLQRITRRTMSNGKHMKGIYSKTKLAGACFEFIPPQPPQRIVICEGFATGASIFQVARIPSIVLAAMSCNNIIHVARVWRKRLQVPLIIAADNDRAGLTAAREVVDSGIADDLVAPPVDGWDWNDYINAHTTPRH